MKHPSLSTALTGETTQYLIETKRQVPTALHAAATKMNARCNALVAAFNAILIAVSFGAFTDFQIQQCSRSITGS